MTEQRPSLARKLGSLDAMLIVMGGIVGTGIFMNPAVVAQRVHTTPLILFAWIFGAAVAISGGLVFAELASRRPGVGGVYGYLRDAFHPMLAFMSGWTALLVSMSGAIAMTAFTFAQYAAPYLHLPVPAIAVSAILVMSAINCLGVREGVTAQNLLLGVKIITIAGIIGAGLFVPHALTHAAPITPLAGASLIGAIGAALLPVLYSYDGWQSAPFMDAEFKDPKRMLPRGLILGVLAVVALYLLVTIAGLKTLGPGGLAASRAPAADIVRLAIGPAAGLIMSVGVAISTLGFLGNMTLTIPRLYYAMGRDGVFFKQLAYVHPKTQAPVVAIAVQAAASIVIFASGSYGQILNYVTSNDFLWVILCAVALLILRARDGERRSPWLIVFLAAVSAAVVVNSYVAFPRDTLIGLAILLSGIPAYLLWQRRVQRIVTECGSARPTTSPRSV